MTLFNLEQIRRTGANLYEVVISNERHEVAFDMIVVEEPIMHVKWGEDFSAFVGMNTGPLGSLFEAVLGFHRATIVGIQPASSHTHRPSQPK